MKKLFVVIASFLSCVCLQAQVFAPGFHSEPATNKGEASDWTLPVGALFSKNGQQLFIWEKRGHVYVNWRKETIQSKYERQETPVINIEPEVGNWEDYGLLGFALDPNFSETTGGFIYLMYCVDLHHLLTGGLAANGYNVNTNRYNDATIGRITRYNTSVVNGKLIADPASRFILLGESRSTGIPLLHNSHSVGSLAFAADGTLLASTGDGASWEYSDGGYTTNNLPGHPTGTFWKTALDSGIITAAENIGAFRAQMLNCLNGKLLRISKETGDGIPSNPFYDPLNPRSPKSRVWALGFRNPYRMSVKPGTGSTNPLAGDIGEVFIGDVGLGLWEELNIVKAPGTNFGWPVFEGSTASDSQGRGYWGIETRSQDELYVTSCDNLPDKVPFEQLVVQDNAAGIAEIYDTLCGDLSNFLASGTRYLHRRPALEWGRNPGNTRVARYDAQGKAVAHTIGTPESGTSGNTFMGNASIGGIWYTGRGNSLPVEYNNTFIVADYGGKCIKRVKVEYTDVVTAVDDLASEIGLIACMAENPIDGSIVYITFDHPLLNNDPAGVHKLVYGGNIPPLAKITLPEGVKNYTAQNTLNLQLIGEESVDPTPGGSIAFYEWDFGDGQSSTDMNPVHNFVAPDNAPIMFVVKLKVTDDEEGEAEKEFIVSLNNLPPTAQITSPVHGTIYRVADDTTYQLRATVTDDHLAASELTYAWQATLVHNNHTHPGTIDPRQEPGAIIKRAGCTDQYSWLITLTVTDEAGLSAVDTVRMYPQCIGTLPIMLHKFSVTQNANVNVVKWSTELEANMEYFEVERSSDGFNFETLDRQDARNTSGTNQYTYADHDFPPGYNYYRLKIVEHGDIVRYSVIVRTIAEAENMELKIVPNPVSGNFSVIYKSFGDDRVKLQIRDISGRVIHTLNENVNRGQNVIYLQNLPNWPSGVYFLSIQNRDEIKRAKFIKTR